MTGNSLIPADGSDAAERKETRVLFIYGLAPRIPQAAARAAAPLTEVYGFGRFASHIETAVPLLPHVVADKVVEASRLGLSGKCLDALCDEVRFLVFGTPRGDLTLAVDAILRTGSAARDVAALVADSCFRRYALTIDDQPVMEWLAEVVDPAGRAGVGQLAFGRDVHQCVFPGGRLRAEIIADAQRSDGSGRAAAEIIYRGTLNFAAGRAVIYKPEPLNVTGHTVTCHGRGVSVVAGWSEAVENTFGIAAVALVSALGVLYRARRDAFAAMEENQYASMTSIGDARALISDLSARLNELQLDLSFGVEAYVDSVLIPELIIESFQGSLVSAFKLQEGLDNTSRMLQRLGSVIDARLSSLQTAVQARDERRSRIFSTAIAVGTVLALPPTLLLSFFGANATQVDPTRSMFDMDRYWRAYALAWVPFVLLLILIFCAQRLLGRADRIPAQPGPANPDGKD